MSFPMKISRGCEMGAADSISRADRGPVGSTGLTRALGLPPICSVPQAAAFGTVLRAFSF